MKALLVIALTLIAYASAAFAEEPAMLKAREVAIASGVTKDEIDSGIKAALWKNDKSAVALSFHRSKGSLCVLLIRQPDGGFKTVTINHVELASFSRLGFRSDHYDRFRTKPIDWENRNDKFYLHFQTQAWKNGRRYTVKSPIVVTLEGVPIYQ